VRPVLGSRPGRAPLVGNRLHRVAVQRRLVALEAQQVVLAQLSYQGRVLGGRQPRVPCHHLEAVTPGFHHPGQMLPEGRTLPLLGPEHFQVHTWGSPVAFAQQGPSSSYAPNLLD
jgi:hypothetical protein